MNKAIVFLLAFVGAFLLLLGLVFLMAFEGGMGNIIIGGVMILIALVIFGFVYMSFQLESRRPVRVEQTYNIQMGGSGELKAKEMRCKGCGAPIVDKDLKLIDGGVVYKCSYCGAMGAMEEEPKW